MVLHHRATHAKARRVARQRELFEFISVPAVCQGIGPVTRNLRAERVTAQRAVDSCSELSADRR